MKRALTFFATLLALGLAFGAFGMWRVQTYVDGPLGLTAPRNVTVPRGATLRGLLQRLGDEGVLEHPDWLYVWARLHATTTVRAGEYLLLADDTPKAMLQKFAEGRVRTERFAVIEGHNRWQVRDALAAAKWMSAADFDRLCDDATYLAKHQIPGPSCEGYLFPDTYTFARGLSAESILGTMFATFHKFYEEATRLGQGPRQLGMREFVTLASIVEKETGAPEERPRIACVFYNRLAAKPAWRLETDPTVIYAATLADPKFDGNIKRSHLRSLAHPYNTYYAFGLPPGPIANPGRAALTAVAQPLTCKDFFFVSMNNGQHVFCPTLDCHNKAVSEWQVRYFRKGRRK